MKTLLFLFLFASLCFGATGAPVALTSVSRAANVVTVTCSATCGIAANQGFSIAGVTDVSFNVNGTAATAADSTHFTFNQTAANASSSAGTVTPAKQVIILTSAPGDLGNRFTGVFWITTTAGLATTASSAWTGASTAEKNAIAAGTTIEIPFEFTAGSASAKATIQGEIQAMYVSRQAKQSSATVQPAAFFGGFSDSVGWSF